MERNGCPKSTTLAGAWFRLHGLQERGASGRLVLAPAALTRGDLAHNFDVVGTAILHLGTRSSVDCLQPHVEQFFSFARPRGAKAVTSDMAKTLSGARIHYVCRANFL